MRARELRRIAANADVDPRTVARYLAGEPLWPATEERIKAVLDALGIVAPRNPSLSGDVAAQQDSSGTKDAEA